MPPTPGDEPVHVLLHVKLPDRPGGLGLVASRIGAMRGDIVDVTVLDHRADSAVDQLIVRLRSSDHLRMVVREVEEVDGVSVEAARIIAEPHDPGAESLSLVASLLEAHNVSELHRIFTRGVCRRFVADWAVLTADNTVVASAGYAPPLSELPDLTTHGNGKHDAGDEKGTADETVAHAHLPQHNAEVLVGRRDHPFFPRERAILRSLSRVTDAVWSHQHNTP
ncbi:MAG: hypothetical protein M5U31_09535 [Acidimicrobiia bacterium]|nr:hypothetical protein [Acidimicrobiia bacterium]